MEERKKKRNENWMVFLVGLFIILFSLNFVFSDPSPVDGVDFGENSTKNYTGTQIGINISGGYISDFNLSVTAQNFNWKAFVGWVIGSFTLEDASGSAIYDWQFTTSTGTVFATRQSGSISWGDINCSNTTHMEAESIALGFNGSLDDNITATFRDNTHEAFPIGGRVIGSNDCPTLNTFNSTGAQDDYFEETALYDDTSIVYATRMENKEINYNGTTADFQMIVPDNASASATGNIIYYMYVELGN